MHTLRILYTSSNRKIRIFKMGALCMAIYWFIVRPWHRKWGSTPGEVSDPMPGDELLPRASWLTTHAITIHAPVDQVWPWVVQIGQGRGGFYSYDWLENLFGLDIHNTNKILPEHQQFKSGDCIPFWRGVGLTVRDIEPPHLLVLAGSLNGNLENIGGSWAFYLVEHAPRITRLIIRTRSVYGPFWIAPLVCLIGEPAAFIMERAMLLGIKKRAENWIADLENPIVYRKSN